MKKQPNKIGEFNRAIVDLLKYIPDSGGTINVSINHSSHFYTVTVPPSTFMHCYAATNMKVKIERREFWDINTTKFVAFILLGNNIRVESYLDSTLPRDAKYLAERR